jgi:hypothetical protein
MHDQEDLRDDLPQESLFPQAVTLTPASPRLTPWGTVLGAAACVLALIALVVSGLPSGGSGPVTDPRQAAQIRTLEREVSTLQTEVAGLSSSAGNYGQLAAQVRKLASQVGSLTLTGLGRYGDTCTQPGFSYPCAPLGQG